MASVEAQFEPSAADPRVQELLRLHGIETSYIDYSGTVIPIAEASRLKVLGLMGLELTAATDLEAAVARCRESLTRQWLPAVHSVESDQPVRLPVYATSEQAGLPIHWSLHLESGEVSRGTFLPEQLPDSDPCLSAVAGRPARLLDLPALPAGYHRLRLADLDRDSECLIIAAPRQCLQPDWLAAGRKLAGLTVHLYALRSERNWGIGDFTDLESLLDHSAATGLDFVILNPLHLLDSLQPAHCSPYSPLDRRFLNPLYLDLEREPDFQDNPAIKTYAANRAFQKRLTELRAAELVDYTSVSTLKLTVLSKMFKHFRQQHLENLSERGRQLLEWIEGKGESLRNFCEFQAERNRLSMSQEGDGQFHCYLQWLAENQLQACQQRALERGMTVGLVRDLAVGSAPDGSEVTLNAELFCSEASIGAPPDHLAPQGQNWGLPPMHPLVLKRTGYRHFIELLQTNMSHSGGLRIDHIMSLMRLWWCPGKDHSGNGAYVGYPARDLFAILRLESQRNGCLVIGEDLGIVPPEIRRLMHDSAVFSNSLFYFEKYDSLHYTHPHHWLQHNLAMVANHDVPTLAAWWSRYDLGLRQQLGLFDQPEQLQTAIRERESDLIQVLHWLDSLELLPDNWRDFNIHRAFDHPLCQAILVANAKSAAQLVSLQPEDLCLTEKPVNIPGTAFEYPNWQRKLPVTVVGLFSDPNRARMLSAFVESRKSW